MKLLLVLLIMLLNLFQAKPEQTYIPSKLRHEMIFKAQCTEAHKLGDIDWDNCIDWQASKMIKP